MELVKGDKKDNVFKNEVILRSSENGVYILNRNGYDCNCPYQPPIRMVKQSHVAIGGSQPETQIVHSPCLSICPLFHMDENEDGTVDVKVGCGNVKYEKLIVK